MDTVGQVANAFNGAVLKEPRGFIKFIEFVVAIFAFATTTSFRSSTEFSVTCNNVSKAHSLSYSYPFDLTGVGIMAPVCNATQSQSLHYMKDSEASSAQFYVFVGVIAFLYCIGALILYIFFDDLYRKNTRIVIVDFVISVALTALWLISSSAWAQGVTNVKFYTDPDASSYFEAIGCDTTNKCVVTSLGNFAGLNVSIMFGFLNFLVWAGNLWFLYKETPWFKIRSKPPTSPADTATQQPPANQY